MLEKVDCVSILRKMEYKNSENYEIIWKEEPATGESPD